MKLDTGAYSPDGGRGRSARSVPAKQAWSLRLKGGRLALLLGGALLAVLAGGYSQAKAVVQVDPYGPAGQQYALPLDSVRGQVSGNPSAGVPGSQSEPPVLFGEGVRPAPSPSGASRPRGADANKYERRGGNHSNSVGSEVNSSVDEAVAALTDDAATGSSGNFGTLGIIAGMMLVGLGAGFLARRAL